MRGRSWPLSCRSTILAYILVTLAHFVAFCHICYWIFSHSSKILVTFGNPCLKNYGNCTATFMYNARILRPVFFSPNLLFLIFWNDCYGGFLAMKSSATTPFYCFKFTPFCERHSFLCIVAVCWWQNEAYTDWYYSILLLSVIINSVTFVTDDFIFAKMERITKFLDKNVFQLR